MNLWTKSPSSNAKRVRPLFGKALRSVGNGASKTCQVSGAIISGLPAIASGFASVVKNVVSKG